MATYFHPSELPTDLPPSILTIGNFDGVHVGHTHLLSTLAAQASQAELQSAVYTFSNHPSQVLSPKNPKPLIVSPLHKQRLLERSGVDIVWLETFTKEFSQASAEEFLLKTRELIPFKKLLLGYDTALGRDRAGNIEEITRLGAIHGFALENLEPICLEDEPVSSSRIREALDKGDLAQVKILLGRDYSVLAPVGHGSGLGKRLGFPTANIPVDGLCLPPRGVYHVELVLGTTSHKGIANLGVAPTIGEKHTPVLEVHLPGVDKDLYGKEVEVIFHHFHRPEIRFSSKEQLAAQIRKDVASL